MYTVVKIKMYAPTKSSFISLPNYVSKYFVFLLFAVKQNLVYHKSPIFAF